MTLDALCRRTLGGRDLLVEAIVHDVPLVVVSDETQIADLRARGFTGIDPSPTAAGLASHEMLGLITAYSNA